MTGYKYSFQEYYFHLTSNLDLQGNTLSIRMLEANNCKQRTWPH